MDPELLSMGSLLAILISAWGFSDWPPWPPKPEPETSGSARSWAPGRDAIWSSYLRSPEVFLAANLFAWPAAIFSMNAGSKVRLSDSAPAVDFLAAAYVSMALAILAVAAITLSGPPGPILFPQPPPRIKIALTVTFSCPDGEPQGAAISPRSAP